MNYSLLDPFKIGFPDHIKAKLTLTSPITKLAFNRLGTYLAVGGDNGDIWVISSDYFTLIRQLKIEKGNPITAISFSHDNNYLAVGSLNGLVTLFDLPNEKLLYTFEIGGPIIYVGIVPRDKYKLIALTKGKDPIIIDYKDDIKRMELKADPDDIKDVESRRWCDQLFDFTSATIDKTGSYLVLGTNKGLVAIYHIEMKEYIHIERNGRTMIKQIMFNFNSKELLLNCRTHLKVIEFNISEKLDIEGNLTLKVGLNYPTKYQGHLDTQEWSNCLFDSSGDYVVGLCDRDRDHKLYVWERSGADMHSALVGPGGRAIDAVWHPTSPMAISADFNGTLWQWAPTYRQKWSGFSPAFSELTTNLIYQEREDAYDLPYGSPSHKVHLDQVNLISISVGNRYKAEEEDAILVDVETVDNPWGMEFEDKLEFDECFEIPLVIKLPSKVKQNSIEEGEFSPIKSDHQLQEEADEVPSPPKTPPPPAPPINLTISPKPKLYIRSVSPDSTVSEKVNIISNKTSLNSELIPAQEIDLPKPTSLPLNWDQSPIKNKTIINSPKISGSPKDNSIRSKSKVSDSGYSRDKNLSPNRYKEDNTTPLTFSKYHQEDRYRRSTPTPTTIPASYREPSSPQRYPPRHDPFPTRSYHDPYYQDYSDPYRSRPRRFNTYEDSRSGPYDRIINSPYPDQNYYDLNRDNHYYPRSGGMNSPKRRNYSSSNRYPEDQYKIRDDPIISYERSRSRHELDNRDLDKSSRFISYNPREFGSRLRNFRDEDRHRHFDPEPYPHRNYSPYPDPRYEPRTRPESERQQRYDSYKPGQDKPSSNYFRERAPDMYRPKREMESKDFEDDESKTKFSKLDIEIKKDDNLLIKKLEDENSKNTFNNNDNSNSNTINNNGIIISDNLKLNEPIIDLVKEKHESNQEFVKLKETNIIIQPSPRMGSEEGELLSDEIEDGEINS